MVDLHLHGQFSLLDGLIKPGPLMERCKELGRGAVALTDHGSLGGLVEFHKAAVKAGIRPILGCEFYHDKDGENRHLVLLARNREGYRNLVRLNNLAQDNFYKKPRITDEMIRDNGRGLILLTACIGGHFAQSVVAGAPDWAWFQAARSWVDAAYLEVQNHGIPGEEKVVLAALASGLPVVATTDAHFLNREDARAHQVGLAVSVNKKEGDWTFPGSGYWVMDDSELSARLPAEALERTAEVAGLVEAYDLGHDQWVLPEVELDPEFEMRELEFRLADYLTSTFGFGEKDGETAPMFDLATYHDRLEYEFQVIRDNGFLPYFKIVADICAFVDGLGHLRGWGRGSAAGSLVAFLYGITKIDPVKWGLFFERFLNPDRVSPPDIDLDFQPGDREPVMEYMRRKWGRVYQIGTYTTLGSKEVILSCSRAMGVRTDLAEFVPVEAPVPPVSELMNREGFARQVELEDNGDFVKVCMALEGLPRNRSAHASGVVIDAAGELPFQVSRTGVNAGLPVTSYDMYSLDDLKFTKIDVLGVNMLAMVDRACRAAGVRVEDFPLDDPETYEAFNSGRTLGVFQFETHSFLKLIRDLHPDTFEELTDLNTLGRPGCLESGMTEEYVARKFGRSERRPIHPKIRDSGHQGLPLFQEQMMEIARDFAGFTMAESDTLRKAIGKKQKDLMDSLRDKFVDGAVARHGVAPEEAVQVWETLEKSARYTWNLSHAVCYTLISYWTMYLAAHHAEHFFCELLNGAGDESRRRLLLSECRRRGVKVVHPHVNEADREPVVRGGRIILGLSGIKFLGDKTLESVLEARGKGGPFASSADLKSRTKVNSRQLGSMLKAGCFEAEYEPTLEDEMESLGYSISGRAIDQGRYKFLDGVGEVIDVRAITTKAGEPMSFTSVEFRDGVVSVVVFPKAYREYKDVLKKGAVLGFYLKDGEILEALFNPDDTSRYKVEVPDEKADEILSCFPSCIGEPNVFASGYGLARVNVTDEMLSFIESEFGIIRIFT